jgi:hypothetical protein
MSYYFSDLSSIQSSVYFDNDVIREFVYDESRKLLISNSTKQFVVYTLIADKK